MGGVRSCLECNPISLTHNCVHDAPTLSINKILAVLPTQSRAICVTVLSSEKPACECVCACACMRVCVCVGGCVRACMYVCV